MVASEFIDDMAGGSRSWDLAKSSGVRNATTRKRPQRDREEADQRSLSSMLLEDALMNG
jgi:hypothetical protein